MNKKKLMFIIVAVLIFISWYYQKYQKNKWEKYRVDSSWKDIKLSGEEEFISSCLDEIDNNYRLGNNKMLEGYNESRFNTNQVGNIIQVSLSHKFYVAKGYFEKMLTNINSLKETNDETLGIKNLLIKAAKTRIEAIGSFTKGCYLKEQIGQTIVANAMTAFKGGSPQAIPEYHGEIENSSGMVTIANSYVVDALKAMKTLVDKTYLKGFYAFLIAGHISYYSDVSETDYDSYLKNGEYYLKIKDYYNAVIVYNLALKVKPKEEDILLNLAKSYIGLGDKEEALKTIEEIKKIDPNNKELAELENKLTKEKKDLEDLGKKLEKQGVTKE